MDDLFLKIISGEIPAAKIYEDEHTFSFLDINPSNKGHALVVPKTRYRNILDMDGETFAALARTAHKVAQALQKTLDPDGINIVMNNEPAAGQVIFHAHMHVIPRFTNDNVFQKAKHVKYGDGEIDTYAEKIRTAL